MDNATTWEDRLGRILPTTMTEDVQAKAGDIALVGCGTWGKNLLRVFGKRLGAVCDLAEEARTWAYTASGNTLLVTGGFNDILGSPWVEAIAIATPPSSHFKLAMAALAQGKHVFVEKPLAMTVAEGEVLLGMAERRDLVLMVGHLMRYHPGFRALQELVKSGKLGKLRYMYAVRGKLGGVRREPDVLWSFAPHDISMILALAGKMPFKVQALGGAYLQPGVPDVTAVDLEFGDVQANLFVNWLHPVKEQRLVVVCEKGIAVFRDGAGDDTLVVHPYSVDGREPVPGEPYQVKFPRVEPLRVEVDHFLACIDNDVQPLTDGAEGLRVLRVLEAAQTSMRTGQAVMGEEDEEHPTWLERLAQDRLDRITRDVGVKMDIEFKRETCNLPYTVHPLADVETDNIGEGTTIWRWTHVMPGASIGRNCMIGQGCFIGRDVKIGDGCRIQNGAQIFEGVTLDNDVFIGPGVVFTNDRLPKAYKKRPVEYTLVRQRASIGANATILCGGIIIGERSMVGAGAVVTRSVPDRAVVVGNPARVL